MRYWLGPWVWDTSGPVPVWTAPAGTLARLDLRSLAAQGTPGPVASGHGLFVTDDATALGADYLECPENFAALDRNRIRSKLGLSQVVLAGGRRGLVLELLTRHAIVDGSTFARPLMPNRLGRLRLAFANRDVDEDHEINLASPFWAKVQTMLQEQYRDYRTRALAGDLPENFHRKFLTVCLEKFSGRITDYHEFIPVDLPDETPLPHSTTLTESFNKADSATLGPDQTWTEVRGTWEVASNQCTSDSATRDSTDTGQARVEADLASDDHYAQVVRVNNPSTNYQGGGGMARFSASANTGYGAFDRGNASTFGSLQQLDKVVAGVATTLGTNTTSYGANATVRCECNGSTISLLVNGNTEVSLTDTAITGNTRAGIHRYDNGAGGDLLFDDWEAADLAAAAGNPWHYYAQQ